MPPSVTISTRTLAAGAAALAAAAGAYLIGTTTRSPSPPQTLVYAAPAANQSSNAGLPGITVTGTGTVNGTPDTLILNLTVTQTRPDVSAALSAASDTMNHVDSALTGRGVASADLKTSGASVQPNYVYSSNSAKLDGYTATESLTATLRDLRAAGAEISAAAQAGGDATRIDGVSLDIQNDTSLMSSARTAAFTDAQDKARQYASAAHESLGKALQVTETVNSPSPIPLDAKSLASGSAASTAVPVNPGTSQVSVTVTVVFTVG
ncbi:MAG TPA: SIMPL domain-containing protein [Actinocrinis sp.]|nr:SIMPL domain-containing protein [Actinocrinis sp.]